ncbi:B3 domain-containing protein At5g60142 [Raphanus sativus]|uniref:B3 domain-containing protein At5g60142 n=1 Tax=Raphanus sativus TaxID=3726 RepID=A0A6J0L4S1_RAPSA|nr:B3 domain-containing protein At5g60142 [Raphanus sativus]
MNKGDSSDDCIPKFFKVYLPDDSGDDLDIPISFNSYLPKSLPEYIIVRSIYGNIWKLKLRKRCGNVEKISMVNGWKRIVKDEDLKGGEFLGFEFDGSRLFNFCIYGHATCKRLGNSVKTKESKDGSESADIIVIDDDDDDDDDDDNQDSGDEDIVVIDDDSSNDVSSGQGSGMEDQSTKDIIVIDEDSSDGDYTDADEDDDGRSGVETELRE